MTWPAVFALAAGAYGFKLLGQYVFAPRAMGGVWLRLAGFLPAALLAALIVVQTFGGDRAFVVDARAAGVAAGAVAALRRAPFVVVIVLAAAVSAGLRALT